MQSARKGPPVDTELQEVTLAKRELTNDEKIQFDSHYQARRKDPGTALVISLLWGVFGVDRFYIGDTGYGVGKLLTFGGFFLWAMIDWFKIRGATHQKNLAAIRETRDVLVQMRPA